MIDEAKSASKDSQISVQMNILCEKIEELVRSVKTLEEKLHLVLRQEVDVKSLPVDEEEVVPLANQIRLNRGGVSNMTASINSISSRLEL